MADRAYSYPQNVPGRYFVDEQCIDCDLCSETAECNFARSDEGHAYVKKQPETPEELHQCETARNSCPVEAIGCDEGER